MNHRTETQRDTWLHLRKLNSQAIESGQEAELFELMGTDLVSLAFDTDVLQGRATRAPRSDSIMAAARAAHTASSSDAWVSAKVLTLVIDAALRGYDPDALKGRAILPDELERIRELSAPLPKIPPRRPWRASQPAVRS